MDFGWLIAAAIRPGPTFSYSDDWPWIWGIGLLLILQLVLIALLLVLRARRLRREVELRQTNRALKAISHCTQVIVRAAQETDLLARTCQAFVEVAGYRMAWVGLAEQDAYKTVRPVARAGDAAGYVDTLDITWADTERGRGPTGRAIRMGQAVVMRAIARDPNFLLWRDAALKCGYASSIALPLLADGHVLGALNLYAADENAFDAAEVKLLTELADDLAYAITALRARAEHRRAADELRKETEKAQQYLDLAGVIFVALNANQCVSLINRKGADVLGYAETEAAGLNWFDTFVPPRMREEVRAVFKRLIAGEIAPAEHYENPVLTRRGEERIIAWHNALVRDEAGRVIGTLSSGEDITERKRAEEEQDRLQAQLYRVQKMDALGQLAGGVAHDFNNILTAILGNVELLRGLFAPDVPPDDPWRVQLAQIDRAAQRAAALTRQMLAFSRRQPVRREVLDVNQILAEMEQMLQRLIGEHITLKFVRAADLGPVRADSGQLEQVVMNLAVNARDAMPNGGKLTIATSNATLDEDYAAAHPEARAGPHVLLAVSDTGSGMSKEVQERLFEPFFTTKPVGQGTGLGLATVYGIVKRFEGHILVYSEPGRGSTFKIFLPAVVTAAPERAAPHAADQPRGGTETLLVCEDDETVRALTAQFLRAAGYTVLPAASATEALRLAAEQHGPLHLLVTDVIIPDLNGKQLSAALTAARPGLKTLYISGYTADVIAHHGVLDPGVELLEKPFGRRALLGRVRALLDGAALRPVE